MRVGRIHCDEQRRCVVDQVPQLQLQGAMPWQDSAHVLLRLSRPLPSEPAVRATLLAYPQVVLPYFMVLCVNAYWPIMLGTLALSMRVSTRLETCG